MFGGETKLENGTETPASGHAMREEGAMILRLKWWEFVIWMAMLLAACGLCYWGVTVDARFIRYAWLLLGILAVIVLIRVFILAFLRVLKDFERLVVLRKGKYLGEREPPVAFVIPWVHSAVLLDSRQHSVNVSGAHCLTTDGVTIDVDLSFFWKIFDAESAAKAAVDNLGEAAKQLATSTLQAKLGARNLDDVLQDRTAMDKEATEEITKAAEDWGVRVWGFTSRVMLPPDLQDAFTKQVEAYRAQSLETQARVDALKKLDEAAADIDHGRFVMKLVALETLSKMGEAQSTKYILPMELAGLVGPLAQSLSGAPEEPEPSGGADGGAKVSEPSGHASTHTATGRRATPPVTGDKGEAAGGGASEGLGAAGVHEDGAPDGRQAGGAAAERAGGRHDGPPPTADDNSDAAEGGAPEGLGAARGEKGGAQDDQQSAGPAVENAEGRGDSHPPTAGENRDAAEVGAHPGATPATAAPRAEAAGPS